MASIKSLSAARQDALARVQAKARAAVARRRKALVVPPGFSGAKDFLRTIADLSGRRSGGRAELARICGVSTSTMSKWLSSPPKRVPTQDNLNRIIAWHRGLLGADARTSRADRPSPAGGAVQGVRVISLARLSEGISARLGRTARLRNVAPLKLAEQILDRHLPSLDELAR